MKPSFRLGCCAILALAAAAPAPARAQLIDDARRTLGYAPDPIERSPRLLGMGRLTYVLDDPRNRIEMWDFAGNPTGVRADDSTSTFELQPATASSSLLRDRVGVRPTRERQVLAAREVKFGYETWHRGREGATYGLVGDLGLLRLDRPVGPDLERRSSFTAPRAMAILNGSMPYLLSDRMLYALRILYAYQTSRDRFRTILDNAAGEYIDGSGDIVPTPEFFTPDHYSVRTLGGGAALSLKVGPPLTVAAGVDYSGLLLKGRNEGGRYASETRENRPFTTYQASAVGRVGEAVEYGIDARRWDSSSRASYVFSLSTGTASPPLAGRGSLYRREEEGTSGRARVRLRLGAFEIGAGATALDRRTDVFAPTPLDTTSFNRFRNVLFYIPNADTLSLPDSVATNRFEDRGWIAGGGLGWTRADRRLSAGVEFNAWSDRFESELGGAGPEPRGWDVRAGAEAALGAVVRVRAGYIHRDWDRDELTRQNEFIANAGTLGLGLAPPGSRWSVESGFLYEWERSDFGDPERNRATRQHLAVRMSWSL